MNDTPQKSPDSGNDKTPTTTGGSLLEEIIKSQSPVNSPSTQGDVTGDTSAGADNLVAPKKVRESISLGDFMKFVGALLFVAVIFLGSFLAYIVFNPDQVGFFNTMFGIDRNDISTLLKKLINGSFGIIMFVLSIIWVISLFRAIWTPKDLKRKRLLSGLTAGLIGIILFSILSLWAYLFQTINATDYTNPEGSILLYDNELYQNPETRAEATIQDGTIIGPITILFDLRSNADKIIKTNGVSISGYRIDTDGGVCNDGKSVIIGTNLANESSIICTFSNIQSYNIRGTYTVVEQNGQEREVPMNIRPIDITGIVNVKKSKNIQGKNIITLDASGLRTIGNPRWIYLSTNKMIESPTITEELTNDPKYICLRLVQAGCDRIFVLKDSSKENVEGVVIANQDPIDPLIFDFSLSGMTIDINQVTKIEWRILDSIGSESIICTGWEDRCRYTFNAYGEKKMRITLELGNGERYDIDHALYISPPIKLSRNMKVSDQDGVLLNAPDTYQTDLKAYVIENALTPPASITLDARDVTATNDGYVLSDVLWKISNGKKIEEKRGERIIVNLDEPLRYTIEAIYTFKKSGTQESGVTRDVVIIDIERKSLTPKVSLSTNSDYIPAIVTIDASESRSENGEIKKFIFDFGEGKTPAEGDAVQQYEYITPGEKNITVTIISEHGEKASIQKTIVLKDQIKNIGFTPSMTPGIVGTAIDFEADGTNGQIQDYIWNFGDNTPTLRGYNVSHAFASTGVYKIELTVIYADGTRDSLTKKYEVRETIE